MNARNPLKKVSEFVASHRGRVTVIFDLDSTLFCVSPRTQAILRTLAADVEFQNAFAGAAEILREIEVQPTDWGIRSVLERHKMEGSLELWLRVRGFWRENFFANGFLHHDQIYPGANAYVRHLCDLGARILYLTGRNSALMREGSVRMLRHWNFPLASESDLYMKPDDAEADETFKVKALVEIVKEHEFLWFFENEPVIIEQVRAQLPSIRIVFMNSVHAGRMAAPTDLPTIGMSYSEGLPGE